MHNPWTSKLSQQQGRTVSIRDNLLNKWVLLWTCCAENVKILFLMSVFIIVINIGIILSFQQKYYSYNNSEKDQPFTVYAHLTHSFPMHPFSTPWKHQKTVRFSGSRERVHWERMSYFLQGKLVFIACNPNTHTVFSF